MAYTTDFRISETIINALLTRRCLDGNLIAPCIVEQPGGSPHAEKGISMDSFCVAGAFGHAARVHVVTDTTTTPTTYHSFYTQGELDHELWRNVYAGKLPHDTYTSSSPVAVVDNLIDIYASNRWYMQKDHETRKQRTTDYGLLPVGFDRYTPWITTLVQTVQAHTPIYALRYTNNGALAVLETGNIVGLWVCPIGTSNATNTTALAFLYDSPRELTKMWHKSIYISQGNMDYIPAALTEMTAYAAKYARLNVVSG